MDSSYCNQKYRSRTENTSVHKKKKSAFLLKKDNYRNFSLLWRRVNGFLSASPGWVLILRQKCERVLEVLQMIKQKEILLFFDELGLLRDESLKSVRKSVTI